MRLSVASAIAVASCAMLSVALNACGGPSAADDQEAIRQTVGDFYAAFSRADGARACALLTPAAQRNQANHRPNYADATDEIPQTRTCPGRVAAVARITVVAKGVAPMVAQAATQKVDVTGDQANAYVRVGQAEKVLTLARVGGRWLIEGVPS
jgi:hypothetical protein